MRRPSQARRRRSQGCLALESCFTHDSCTLRVVFEHRRFQKMGNQQMQSEAMSVKTLRSWDVLLETMPGTCLRPVLALKVGI